MKQAKHRRPTRGEQLRCVADFTLQDGINIPSYWRRLKYLITGRYHTRMPNVMLVRFDYETGVINPDDARNLRELMR